MEAGGRFDDLIAYGGLTMDDHHPGGLATPEPPNVFHPAPSPFGIPYRCLYSLAVTNLMFAGRNISATHAALSATRVMATCATLGQAAGTAAALAVRWGEGPDGVYRHHLRELQQALMDDDCYLPFRPRPVGDLTARTAMTAAGRDASVLKNGWDRPVGGQDNGVFLAPGEPLTLRLPAPEKLHGLRLILDSDLTAHPAGNPPGADAAHALQPPGGLACLLRSADPGKARPRGSPHGRRLAAARCPGESSAACAHSPER